MIVQRLETNGLYSASTDLVFLDRTFSSVDSLEFAQDRCWTKDFCLMLDEIDSGESEPCILSRIPPLPASLAHLGTWRWVSHLFGPTAQPAPDLDSSSN